MNAKTEIWNLLSTAPSNCMAQNSSMSEIKPLGKINRGPKSCQRERERYQQNSIAADDQEQKQ